MRDDFTESIWVQFAVEAQEHLDEIDAVLIEAEKSRVDSKTVTVLFRAFHSLKGLANVLDLFALESLTHVAEDFLELVRQGQAKLDGTSVALLLHTTDALKALCHHAITTRTDGTEPTALVSQLKELCLANSGVTPDPAATLDAAVQEAAPHALHEDPEMLAFFAEVLADNIPALLEFLQRKEGVDLLVESLQAMAHSAEAMGFDALKTQVQDVLTTVSAAGSESSSQALSATDFSNIVLQLMALHKLLAHLQNEYGLPLGVERLALALGQYYKRDYEKAFEAISAVIDQLEARTTSVPQTKSASISRLGKEDLYVLVSNLDLLYQSYQSLLPKSRGDLLLLLQELVVHAIKDETNLNAEFCELTRSALNVLHPTATPQQDRVSCDRIIQQLTLLIRSNGQSDADGQKSPTHALEITTGIMIDPLLRSLLTPDNLKTLEQAIEQGNHLYQITADLESSENVAMRFMQWVEENAQIITSHLEFLEEKNLCLMLLCSKADLDQVQRELDSIDASMMVRSCQDQKSAPTQTLGSASMIRVAGESLDALMNQVGEMVLLRAQLSHIVADPLAQKARVDLRANRADSALFKVADQLERQQNQLEDLDAKIHSALSRLQEGALELRVVPLETVLRRLPRMVRDLAQTLGKQIRLDMQGQEVRIDKAMVEVLTDPLMHMVRNSASHGIGVPAHRLAQGKPAEGTILIRAFQSGPRVIIKISDDGIGIHHEKVLQKAIECGLVTQQQSVHLSQQAIYDFLFVPGFSTAQEVNAISGRGVGLDVVRNNVMRLGGAIAIESEFGKGTTFTLEMPLSVAVQDALLVAVGNQTLALPARFVNEVLAITHQDIQSIKAREAILLRGAFLPLVALSDLLGFARSDATRAGAANKRSSHAVVVLSNGVKMVGLVVDSIVGRRDLFIKEIPARLAALPGVGGASILGDGSVVLILDGEALLRLAQSTPSTQSLTLSLEPIHA